MTEQPYTLNLFDYSNSTAPESSVECFGIKFDNEEARRSYFLELLRKKLQEPEFRNVEGFPIGEDEDILAISDPPYYTACPNPWLTNFIEQFGKQYDTETDNYQREPFTADVSEGKTDGIFTAHSYHTKVPHKAIVRYILHYTEPDDIILDAFGGSGMTGVAAQICAKPDPDFRYKIETERKAADLPPPKWGSRRVVLNDLGVAATFIEANYNLPFNVEAFEREARHILNELKQEIGWMYETLHTDGKTKGQINYTIWSEVFACPECSGEIIFFNEALEKETKRVKDNFPCPHCSVELTKNRMDRLYETYFDSIINKSVKGIKRLAVLINYSIGKNKYEKQPDENDLAVLNKVSKLSLPLNVPTEEIPFMHMTHQRARMESFGITHVHHFFLSRAAQSLGILWSKAIELENRQTRNMLLFFIEQAVRGMSLLNRYKPIQYGKIGGSQVGLDLNGVYYVPSISTEVSPWYQFEGKLQRLVKAFGNFITTLNQALVTTGTAAKLGLPDNSIDYIFTDPPFGENIYYSDLNFLVESWHRVHTDAQPEAIVDKAKGKELLNYQKLMQSCLEEYNRVLKPGRWMTVVFHNSRNAVWNAIQEAMLSAGFVVADVRTLDKQQGSYRQVTSTAVKQDLVISAYKPTTQLEKIFELEAGTEEGAWEFVQNHLKQLPVFISENNQSEIIVERLNYLLFDRMVAFHIQRDKTVPLSASEFYLGLEQRFSKRDDMYFLPEQLAEYEKKRMTVKEVLQLELFITDESSAILWLKQQLTKKPYTSQELNPIFMKEKPGWSKYEKSLELDDLLRENFICYEGEGVIPTQIISWLKQSSIYRERIQKLEPNSLTEAGLETTDTILINEAKKRWYIPDPNKTGDIEKLRERSLLKEFEEYKDSKEKKFKIVRLEAVRAGFKKAWQERNYQTIIDIASKIHDNILQEDSKLLMWYDQALNRVGDDNV